MEEKNSEDREEAHREEEHAFEEPPEPTPEDIPSIHLVDPNDENDQYEVSSTDTEDEYALELAIHGPTAPLPMHQNIESYFNAHPEQEQETCEFINSR